MPDPAAVNSMFARIARRYDFANRLLSGGIDLWWRRRLVAHARRKDPKDILDLATGSGDVAFSLARGIPGAATILGMDFCQPMLDQAERKRTSQPAPLDRIRFQPGDALNLPSQDSGFDLVTISFGLRNLADRDRGLREMFRVLRPGGRLLVLEFSQPYAWFRPLYFFYLRQVLPRLAGLVTGDRAAYDYLNRTIGEFPDHTSLGEELRRAGFTGVQAHRLTFGIVALHEGTRPARA